MREERKEQGIEDEEMGVEKRTERGVGRKGAVVARKEVVARIGRGDSGRRGTGGQCCG